MFALISPAKTLDFETQSPIDKISKPFFTDKANKLSKVLSNFSIKELTDLMNISHELAELNYSRFKMWNNKPTHKDLKQALLAFTGEVFRGIDAYSLNKEDFEFAQNHVRILSGLYGVLRPLDGIQAYRLEMGTKLKHEKFKNLYGFWGNEITQQINDEHKEGDYIINLASNEYFKALKPKMLKCKIITPVFKDFNKGELKVVTVYAKNARGKMIRFIIKNRITAPEQLKLFDINGYAFDDKLSDNSTWVFVR
jgi:uncharacterized protein